jgi:hypothetical protein
LSNPTTFDLNACTKRGKLSDHVYICGGRCGRDRIVVGFITTCAITAYYIFCTTKVVSLNPAHGKVYSIQHYVTKFVSNLRQVGAFLHVLWFPPPKN